MDENILNSEQIDVNYDFTCHQICEEIYSQILG